MCAHTMYCNEKLTPIKFQPFKDTVCVIAVEFYLKGCVNCFLQLLLLHVWVESRNMA